MTTTRWCCKLSVLVSLVALSSVCLIAQQLPLPSATDAESRITQRIRQSAAQFLAQRGLSSRGKVLPQSPAQMLVDARTQQAATATTNGADGDGTSFTASWTPLGPTSVQTAAYGLISGRVTSIAVDPNDPTGNTVYVGTTGGGVWKSTNAAGPAASITFTPLTDAIRLLSNGSITTGIASLSIGAISVQPVAGAGAILAGTGDTNDGTDSYYGMGILRSTDGGITWTHIQTTPPFGQSSMPFSFIGEGFAGFAWSTANPHLVVAAVSQSLLGNALNARATNTFAGLYYSSDDGQSWQLATITDDSTNPGRIIQSPSVATGIAATGNSATSVTWNPVRQRFYAAIKYHGYYESTDGQTFVRLANQPEPDLSTTLCPTNPGSTGSPQCPIYRGVITTQPVTGDMFTLTVSSSGGAPSAWKDEGISQDLCSSTGNGCTTSSTVMFGHSIQTASAIDDASGYIPQGDYNLTLAAIPSPQDTLLFVGTEDIFGCSLANGCTWRNTTTSPGAACASAGVAPSEHAIAWVPGTQLIYFGNDGGLWRTTDEVNQLQSTCSAGNRSHFDNLNGSIGSLAEVSDFSADPSKDNVMMAAMGAFGTAALQGSSSNIWTQILAGEGDQNAIDPQNPQSWYTTSAGPVSIDACNQGAACNQASFVQAIDDADVSNDGLGLIGGAPWILDPQNSANVILGTCRVWRGPANDGSAWAAGSNALSGMLDHHQGPSCAGNAPIQSLAASGSPSDVPGTPETIYAGLATAGIFSPTSIGGHIYAASVSSTTAGLQLWRDLSSGPVTNGHGIGFNPAGRGISSIYVDPHDASGNTVYVTVQAFIGNGVNGGLLYRTTDGGNSWANISDNLPLAPANSVVVDSQDANTVYVALDIGVYATRDVSQCAASTEQNCWNAFDTDLPNAPVTQLRIFTNDTESYLRAATYGRGIWQVPTLTAGAVLAAATLSQTALNFPDQQVSVKSPPQTLTVQNTGQAALHITAINITPKGGNSSPDFRETDNCTQQPIAPGGSCTIQVVFVPSRAGALQDELDVLGNVPTGQLAATLTGNGLPVAIVLTPSSLDFGNVLIGAATQAQNVTISNTGSTTVNLQSFAADKDFHIAANTCGTALPTNFGCTVAITFAPMASGEQNGSFTLTSDQGVQTVTLTGNGQAPATANLSTMSLQFPAQTLGTESGPLPVLLTNNGDAALAGINIAVTGDFIGVNNCGPALSGHSTCSFSISFAPKQIGPEQGLLTVKTNAGPAQTVTLSGSGLAPVGISASPAIVNFGGQAVGVSSSLQRVTLTNNTGADQAGWSFAADDTTTGATTNEFAVADSNCPASNVLAANTSCYIDLAFTPSVAGARTGTFTMRSSSLNAAWTVVLTGAGEDFQLQVDGQPSAVIVQGQTATYRVLIVPVNGSTETVTLSCAGAPQNAACSLSPASVPLDATGAYAFSTITVATSASAASASTAFRLWQKAGIVLGALLPCIFLSGRRRKMVWRGWLVCFVSLLLMLPAACSVHASGGGSTGAGGSSGTSTPLGTYTVTITGTIPGLQRSVPLTLTVQ